ncbi:MAG: hypothetical protein DMG39_12275 [Acidobacteria bacterium]|nr:MAG: hypothetical protein DMG39_12275 [Acidobacteriota bacterium]
MFRAFPTRPSMRNVSLRLVYLGILLFFFAAVIAAQAQDREEEIIANLAGGCVIVHVARDTIVFAAIDHAVESNSIPPRVAGVDSTHIGVLFGASEWRIPADPKPIRLDRNYQRVGPQAREDTVPGEAEPDLELIGTVFLEKLRPLVGRLHHKVDFSPDDPVFQMVIIGYAPGGYGPEVWVVEYHMEQEQIATRGEEYWQTRVLRPHFTQLYPPEKHAPHTLVESRYPANLKGPTLEEMIKSNDPRLGAVLHEPRFEKVLENLRGGTAQKAAPADSIDFMRAVMPLLAGNSSYVIGTMDEQHGMNWVVPPSEPIEKAEEDRNRPPDAPTLRRPIKP